MYVKAYISRMEMPRKIHPNLQIITIFLENGKKSLFWSLRSKKLDSLQHAILNAKIAWKPS